jgi:hypothetical protein
MGADLIVTGAWAPVGRKMDRDAAYRTVGALEEGDMAQLEEETGEAYESLAALRESLLVSLKEFESVWTGEAYARDMAGIEVGQYSVLLTGGMSWGDTPTESYDVIRRLEAAGVLRAAGFYDAEPSLDEIAKRLPAALRAASITHDLYDERETDAAVAEIIESLRGIA